MTRRITSALLSAAAATVLCTALPCEADTELFEISEIPTEGRVVTAGFADFDGDGRQDLMIATLGGIPPAESRTIHVFRGQTDGQFTNSPDYSTPIPRYSAVYDIADIRETPGDELLLLRPDGVTILSVTHDSAGHWHLPVDGPSTVGAGDDERGFDPFRLVYNDFGVESWILVPQIGQVSAMTTEGDTLAVLDVGRRANYFVTRESGFFSGETDIQLYFDAPKLSVGDVDGDGLADIVATTRHEIRVFLRNASGAFTSTPSYTLSIALLDPEDHARGSGAVASNIRDLDGDGRLDLMISHTAGNFTDSVTTTYVYKNEDGRWNLSAPDDRFESKSALSSDLLLDIDSDGAMELVRTEVEFGVLEIVEFLLTRALDVKISVHRLEEDGSYGTKPRARRKIGIEVGFDTFRPKGFMPTGTVDLNGDGRLDFVSSAAGKGIEVYLGSDDGLFSRRRAFQKLPSAGVIRFDDYDGDSRPDFILYDPQSFDAVVRVGRNTRALDAGD